MRSALLPCLATIALIAVAPPIEAQNSAPSDRPFITGRALGGAFLGAVGGGLLGGVTGFYIGGNRCVDPGVGDTCHYLAGLAIGTAIGVTLGTPIGAHYLNRRRGNFGLSLLASTVIGSAAVLALRQQDDRPAGPARTRTVTAIVIAAPVLQILSSAAIESR